MAAPKNPQTGPNPKKAPKNNRTKPSDPLFEKTRQKIQNSQIVNCLINHVVNNKKMSSTQVTAGLGLLRKTLPDLQASAHSVKAGGDFQDMLDEIFTDKDK